MASPFDIYLFCHKYFSNYKVVSKERPTTRLLSHLLIVVYATSADDLDLSDWAEMSVQTVLFIHLQS